MLELKNLTFEVPLSEGSSEKKRIIDDLTLTIPDDRFTVITDSGARPEELDEIRATGAAVEVAEET
mgnify:CR=1 FL=1